MQPTEHNQGVGLLIHSLNTDQFFIQQKDETYPTPSFRGSYAFWGGEMEQSDRSVIDALHRELTEELAFGSEIIQQFSIEFKGVFSVVHPLISYDLHLFYLGLSDLDFSHVTKQQVYEGIGVVKSGIELANSKWICDSNPIFTSVYEKLR